MTKRDLSAQVERLRILAKMEGDLIRAIDKYSITTEVQQDGTFTYFAHIPEDKLRKIAQGILNKLDKLK